MPSTEAPPASRPAARDLTPATRLRTDRRRTDTREKIIASAMRLFGSKGYSATSIAEIERAVGLRPGSGGLYRHFPSKESLFVAAITEYAERVQALRLELACRRDERGEESAIDADLRQLVIALADFLTGEQPVVQATSDAASLPGPVRAIIGAAWNDGYGMAEDIFVAHGVSPEHAPSFAVAAIGSLNHFVTHLGYWGEEPNGVRLERFIDEWVALWSQAARSSTS